MKVENINLIRKIVWSFYNSTGLEWEELFQEATLYYYRALKSYDPSRGNKLTTHIWQSISCELINYINKTKKTNSIYSSIDINNLHMIPVKSSDFEFSHFIESLTTDAQEIVRIVLTGPKPYDIRSSKKAKERIVNVLEARGWAKERINASLENLRLVFS